MGQARDELRATFGTIDNLRTAAERLGVNFDKLWTTDKPRYFAEELKKLNDGLQNERELLGVLAKQLDETAASGALMSEELFKNIAARTPGGDTGILAFMKGQQDAAIRGLDTFLSNATVKTQEGATAISASLAGIYQSMIEGGASPSAAFAAIEPAVQKLQEQLAKAGLSGTAAFQPLADVARYAADTIAGPVFDAMAGLEQGMTATFNLGLMNQDAYKGFAEEVTVGFHALEEQGRGGVAAAQGMRGALQKLWELQHDFGYETSQSQQELLDFAESSGLIGEKFRPAADRMVSAIDNLVERLDKLFTKLTEDLPDAMGKGASQAGEEFSKNFKPNIPPIEIPGHVVFDEKYREGSATYTGPAFAAGAVVRRPTIALIGEKGPEAVVPLPNEFGTQTDLTVLLDSEVLTRAVLRKQPRTMRAYGVAR